MSEKKTNPGNFVPLIKTENELLEKQILKLELQIPEEQLRDDEYTENCYTENCYTENCYTERASDVVDYDSRLTKVVKEIAKEISFPEFNYQLDTMPKKRNFVLKLVAKETKEQAQEKWPELVAKINRRLNG